MTAPATLSLADAARALRTGDTSAEKLARAALDRQARFAPLMAYKSLDPEITLAHARAADTAFAAGADTGLLQGIPVSVKDLYAVDGFPVFAGTPRPLPEAFRIEGPVIQALRRQLGVVTGKTHTVEIAFGGLGTNSHWGTPRNPWDADDHRVPGGSSAGAGISLIEGSAFLALGTDTAGSVRVPASMTGTVGLKTSQGRWSLDGIFPLSPSLDTAGLLARSVADLAWGFAALDPRVGEYPAPRGGVAGLRLGVPDRHFPEDCSPGILEGFEAGLAELERAGAVLVPFAMPECAEAWEYFTSGGLAASEAWEFLNAEIPEVLESLDDMVRQRLAEGGQLPAHEYLHRRRRLGLLGAAVADRLQDIDALVCPTVPETPPLLSGVERIEDYRARNLQALRNTCMANLLGFCALTLPVALDAAGMPVGLTLMAPAMRDESLLALAGGIETVLGSGRERLGIAPLCAG